MLPVAVVIVAVVAVVVAVPRSLTNLTACSKLMLAAAGVGGSTN